MTRLYEDERFVQEKVLLEEQIMEASQTAVEGKNFIQEMDEFLKDLDQWKSKRSEQQSQDAQQTIENDENNVEKPELQKLDAKFMQEEEERERLI